MSKQKPAVEKLKKKLLSIDEVAAVLDTSPSTIRSLVKKGYIKYLKIGRDYKVYEFELDVFINKHLGQQLILNGKDIRWEQIEEVS